MTTPESTAETIVRQVLERFTSTSAHYYPAGFYDGDADNATDEILAALTAAGLLMEPGGETRAEWGLHLIDNYVLSYPYWNTRVPAGLERAQRIAAGRTHHGTVVCRTVHTGQWREPS